MNANKNGSSDRTLIVYDGECVFCSRSMAWIAEHDTRDRIRFTPCTSETGNRLMKDHGIDPADPSTFLAIIDGKPYIRSEAMLKIVPLLDIPAQPLRILRLVPGFVRNIVYDWTARNRRSLVKGACPIPSAAMRARILE